MDIMSLFHIKRENTEFGFYSFLIFALIKIFVFIGNCISDISFIYYDLFSLLFYLSIIGLCLRGFKYDRPRLVDVGSTILFIYSGVQGFIMLPSISIVSGDILFNIYTILNFMLNLLTCAAFSLFVSNWIRPISKLGDIERILLFIASIISVAIFVIYIFMNLTFIKSNISFLFSCFTFLSNVVFYIAMMYSTYYLYK
ncbi:MAG: hypothetical protein ACI31G_04615 [Bacilli bacterium]